VIGASASSPAASGPPHGEAGSREWRGPANVPLPPPLGARRQARPREAAQGARDFPPPVLMVEEIAPRGQFVRWQVVQRAASMAAKAFFPSWQVPQFRPAAMLAMVNFSVPRGMVNGLGWQSAQFGMRVI